MKVEENGLIHCAIRDTYQETNRKVGEMHLAINEISKYVSYLKKLDELSEIRVSNSDIRDKLLSSATGYGRIETKVIMPVIYALCFMLVAIVIWFTGVEPNLPNRGGGYSGESR